MAATSKLLNHQKLLYKMERNVLFLKFKRRDSTYFEFRGYFSEIKEGQIIHHYPFPQVKRGPPFDLFTCKSIQDEIRKDPNYPKYKQAELIYKRYGTYQVKSEESENFDKYEMIPLPQPKKPPRFCQICQEVLSPNEDHFYEKGHIREVERTRSYIKNGSIIELLNEAKKEPKVDHFNIQLLQGKNSSQKTFDRGECLLETTLAPVTPASLFQFETNIHFDQETSISQN